MGPGEARGGRRCGAHPCRTRGDEAWSRSALPAPEEPPLLAAGPPAAGLRDCGVLFPFLTPQLAAPQNQCALLSKSSSSRVAVRCEGKPRGLARRAPTRGQVPASPLPPLAPPWPAPASAPSRWAEGVTSAQVEGLAFTHGLRQGIALPAPRGQGTQTRGVGLVTRVRCRER